MGPWKLIKYGFWLGVGFMIPTLLVTVLSGALMFVAPLDFSSEGLTGTDIDSEFSGFASNFDQSGNVHILEHREVSHGDRLLVLGRIENRSAKSVGLVTIEVELLDADGGMVYECSGYVQKIAATDIENFQVTCGCGEQALPAHASMSVRVASASSL